MIVLGLSKFSSAQQEAKAVQFETSTEASTKASFKSPVKSAQVTNDGTPINQKVGTVQTPAGRRSARLARRKED